MKRKHLTLEDVLDILRAGIKTHGTQANYADFLGITQGYINDMLKRKRDPGPKVLDALGLEKVVVYREKE